jgi:hypothetical protein
MTHSFTSGLVCALGTRIRWAKGVSPKIKGLHPTGARVDAKKSVVMT